MGGLNRAVVFSLLLAANSCRCNSVDDHELPVAAVASSESASPSPSAAPKPSGSGTLAAEECGPDIGGIEKVVSAPALLLGELPGTASAPAFAGDLACRLAFSNHDQGVLLALEIPSDEQGRLDAFLASEGRTTDRAAVTAGKFWNGQRDGHSSVARLDLLERVRVMNRRGATIRVRAIDTAGVGRNEVMAKNVIAAVNEKRGPVLVLVGSAHARTRSSGNEQWMGERIRAAVPGVVSLDSRYGEGEAWSCSPDCGRHKVTAQDTETDGRWRIDLFDKPDDKGFAGVWRIGPARASDPAVAP